MSHTDRRAGITRRSLFAAIATAASLFALAGCASTALADQGVASLEVFDRDTGQVLQTYRKDGRQFVPGRPGARYAVRVRNLTSARVLVVLSIDGVNVISGETADWRQVGYVLDPGRSYDINGWRKSNTEVAAFEFAPVERSYAALTGRPGNVGVIGMAAFRERVVAPPPAAAIAPPSPPVAARSENRAADAAGTNAQAAAPAPVNEKSVAADAAGARLGTGHGQREWSISQRTGFERATASPQQVIQLEYDSYERLVAAGVIPDPYAYLRPQPFPSNRPGFVPDPPVR
jgi:hypothetical protein